MKLLVVDDETLLRERIMTTLKNSNLSIDTYLSAQNAFEALEIIEKEHPKIVITDIRMPKMSGLELADRIRKQSPDTIIILLTGYSEFEYAHFAIQKDVFAYLLKPVESEKLISVILDAQKKIEAKEKKERLFHVFKEHFANNLQSIQKQYIENLLFSNTNIKDADLNRDVYGLTFSKYRLIAISCSTTADVAKLESEYYCTHLVEEYIHNLLPKTVTYVFGNLVFMIWEIVKDDIFDDNKDMLKFLNQLNTYAQQNFLGILSAGISMLSDTLSNLQILRYQTSECLEYLQNTGKSDFILHEDILSTDVPLWEIKAKIEALVSEINSGNADLVLKSFNTIIENIEQNQPDYLYSACLLLTSHVCFMIREYNFNTADLSRAISPILSQLENHPKEGITALRIWIQNVCNLVSTAHQNRTNALIDSIYEYININYCHQIGLAEASRYVGRNPSYISRLVSEQTGKSFTQLLTDKRINEAKTLLAQTNLKLAEISERIGYTNVNYFTKVFKATTNMTANDYRNFSKTFGH